MYRPPRPRPSPAPDRNVGWFKRAYDYWHKPRSFLITAWSHAVEKAGILQNLATRPAQPPATSHQPPAPCPRPPAPLLN